MSRAPSLAVTDADQASTYTDDNADNGLDNDGNTTVNDGHSNDGHK